MIMSEYLCPHCSTRFESLELGEVRDHVECPTCAQPAGWVISAPKIADKTRKVQAVTTAKSDPRPANCLDTRTLGDGRETPAEWNKRLDKQDADARRQWVKDRVGT